MSFDFSIGVLLLVGSLQVELPLSLQDEHDNLKSGKPDGNLKGEL